MLCFWRCSEDDVTNISRINTALDDDTYKLRLLARELDSGQAVCDQAQAGPLSLVLGQLRHLTVAVPLSTQ